MSDSHQPILKDGKIKIFISYRRADTSGYVRGISSELCLHFGEHNVFMDFDSIKPGENYPKAIDNKVGSCDVLLAVIGKEWLSVSDKSGRRLDNPEDLVRREIASALKQGILVIPVIVEGAEIPTEKDLPNVLKPLAQLQALELSNRYWREGMNELIETIEESIVKAPVSEPVPPILNPPPSPLLAEPINKPSAVYSTTERSNGSKALPKVLGILLILGVGIGLWKSCPGTEPDKNIRVSSNQTSSPTPSPESNPTPGSDTSKRRVNVTGINEVLDFSEFTKQKDTNPKQAYEIAKKYIRTYEGIDENNMRVVKRFIADYEAGRIPRE